MNMDEQMYMIMARVLSNEAAQEEQQQLHSWMEADVANREAFEEMRRLWSDADEVLSRPHFDTDAAWAKVQGRIGMAPAAEKPAPASRTISFPSWLRYSLGVAAALVVGIFLVNRFNGPEMKEVLATVNNQEVVLPDASHVWLREGSSLRYPASFKGNERQVSLNGEAFFDVTKKPEQPFVIDARSVAVKVVGTSFNVRSTDAVASVYVATGKVQVTGTGKASGKVLVVPGELAELKPDGRLEKRNAINANDLYWKTREMSFDGVPLSTVVAEISRICMVPVKLDAQMSSSHRSQLIKNVTFRKQSLEDMLNELCQISRSRLEKQGEGYLLRAQ